MFKLRRKPLWIVGVLAIVSLSAYWFFVLRTPPDLRAAYSVRNEWQFADNNLDAATKEELAARCLAIGRQFPGTTGGMLALQLAAARAPKSSSGQQALGDLQTQISTAEIEPIAQSLYLGFGPWRNLAPCAPAILERARRSPSHARVGQLVATVCSTTLPDEGFAPPPIYHEAADLIANGYADRNDIARFCEGLYVVGVSAAPWGVDYERHLRAILEANQDRYVRCSAQFALASVVHAAPDDRQAEAQELFETFCKTFAGTHKYSYQQVEQMLLGEARDHVKELQYRAVGMPAPVMSGADVDGRPMKLSGFRGKTVLLSFWGTWCFPCMKLVPHERDLAAKLAGRPFSIVGVNCDDEVATARTAMEKHQMTWPMFFNNSGDGQAITKSWRIMGFPTLYLIDHLGVIRRRWIGAPPGDEMQRMSEILVDAAERKLSADEMTPVVQAIAAAAASPLPAPAPSSKSSEPDVASRFQDKVYRAADGRESKYVVYVPAGYDGTVAPPVLLYLHGSGSRGDDGRRHLEYELAREIRSRPEAFPFLVVFPQAHEDEDWTADSAGGQRALAILDQVQTDFKVDADRVYLSGHSMGGQGTWSLAAHAPQRWAAIVPISHGWQTDQADKLAAIPCWCFHGAADKMIPIAQSRDMVTAIREASGKILYQEFAGVGHDDCVAAAYAMPELLEWLLAQKLAAR